jgi:hypothetical protein
LTTNIFLNTSLAFPLDCHSNFEWKKTQVENVGKKTSVSLALLCFALSLSLQLIFAFGPKKKKKLNIEKIIHMVKVNKEMIEYHLQGDP